MIERVAEAIWNEMGTGKSNRRDFARVAIKAMREPTDAMIEAGWNFPGSQPDDHWQAMIDEALKP